MVGRVGVQNKAFICKTLHLWESVPWMVFVEWMYVNTSTRLEPLVVVSDRRISHTSTSRVELKGCTKIAYTNSISPTKSMQ